MKSNLTSLENYQKQAIKAALAIVFFLTVYIFLVLVTFIITILFSYLGIAFMSAHPGFITLMLGLGMIGLGFMLLFFLFKFLFTSNKVDRSSMIEIHEKDQPQLFQFIQMVAKEAQAPLPKRVYLTAEVNASVFYDSSFWSMFFPVKKNLVIGLGLVNSVTISEFKAILAHEFGHFSQRTMKIGSYVYNVNHVIYNMLYENEGYNNLLEKWANISGYFAIFAHLAVYIVKAFQWILKKTYNIVNLAYMGLSREMEFQADRVAALVAGSEPLLNSLHRLDLSNYAYNDLLHFYGEKIEENLKTDNLYPQHTVIMQHLATDANIPLQHGLPQVTETVLNRLDQSKIVIKDQWASHPSNSERSSRLRALNIPANTDDAPAWNLFTNSEDWQKRTTQKLFHGVQYAQPATDLDVAAFQNDYFKDAEKFSFNKRYNGFYNQHAIQFFDIQTAIVQPFVNNYDKLEDIFNNDVNNRLYAVNGLSRDIEILEAIQKGQLAVKNFDYDGVKYKKSDSTRLLKQLRAQLEAKSKEIVAFDIQVFQFFYCLAQKVGKQEELVHRYERMFVLTQETEQDAALYTDIMNILQFVNKETPYKDIENGFIKAAEKELVITKRIRHMLTDDTYQAALRADQKAALEKYISQDWEYFKRPNYNDEALATLFQGLHTFFKVSTEANLKIKRELLDFQIAIADQTAVANQAAS